MPATESRRRARGRRELNSARSRSMRGYYTGRDALGRSVTPSPFTAGERPGRARVVRAVAAAPAGGRRRGRTRRKARDAVLRPAGLPLLQAAHGGELPPAPDRRAHAEGVRRARAQHLLSLIHI